MADIPQERDHDFFRHSSGRLLWDEEERIRERYRFFNLSELQRVATSVTGSTQCSSMSKIGEGNYNKVFKPVMDNGSVAMTRIPEPNAGPLSTPQHPRLLRWTL
jgi:hypothetical protein